MFVDDLIGNNSPMIDGNVYRKILGKCCMFVLVAHGAEAFYRSDNDPKHISKVTREFVTKAKKMFSVSSQCAHHFLNCVSIYFFRFLMPISFKSAIRIKRQHDYGSEFFKGYKIVRVQY